MVWGLRRERYVHVHVHVPEKERERERENIARLEVFFLLFSFCKRVMYIVRSVITHRVAHRH